MKKNKASILVIVLLILGVILMISLTVSLVAIKQKQASLGAGKSNLAFQNTDSGIEKVMSRIMAEHSIRDLEDEMLICDPETKLLIDRDGKFTVELKDANGTKIHCDAPDTVPLSNVTSLKSIGFGANQDSRSIEAAVVKKDVIQSNSDVMILMDYSSSLSIAEFAKEKSEVVDLIGSLGPDYRVGVVFFNGDVTATDKHPLTTMTDKSNLISFINNFPTNPTGGTNTAKAIETAKNELVTSSRYGINPQAMVLVTDGVPNISCSPLGAGLWCHDRFAKCDTGTWATNPGAFWNTQATANTLDVANAAKGEPEPNIEIFTIGVGFNSLNSAACINKATDLMRQMASSGAAGFFMIDNFNSLKNTLDQLTQD